MDYLRRLFTEADWQIIALASDKENVADLMELYDELNLRYANYQALISAPGSELLPSEFEGHKDLLSEYYEDAPVRLKEELRKRRNEHGLRVCPYCGNPVRPRTLDHFIPKEQWPEYSIYPNNLVPQCVECAPIKGRYYYCSEALSAFFVHPIYSDLLSRVRFGVVIEVSVGLQLPSFTPRFWAGGLAGEDLERVRRHLKKVKVHDRMLAFFRAEFEHWKHIVSEHKVDIRNAMQQRVRERVSEGDRARDWKAAFCQGVIESPSAMEYFASLIPARHAPVEVAELEEFPL